ncbi:toll-like receptor 7 [Phlebotomus argentipes]|uniref:toll-like receptor 7 n=1 Tax=Phlebotomus argentipes TaxID=94469 RepID=UPI00289369E7|nr:toll-like receptor 7 [Phlebotomus argentipes]
MNALNEINLNWNLLTNVNLRTFRSSEEMKINTLYLRGNYLTEIDLCNITLPELENFDLSENRLKSVTFSSLNLPVIKQLRLWGNHIFQFNIESQMLKHIDLSKNRIKSLEGSSLDAPELIEIDLRDNRLITITPDWFLSSPKLMSIWLNRNPLQSFNLRELTNIQRIELINSEITSMDNISLPTSSDIHLNLDYTITFCLDSNKSVDNVEYFTCKVCNIHSMEPFYIANTFRNIKYLRLSHNHLTTANIFNAKEDLDLKVVHLMHNYIRKINKDDFSRLTNVRTLDLSYNDINSIAEGSLDGMEKLEMFAISNNLIFKLPERLFEATPNLIILYVQNNNLPFLRIPGWQEDTGEILSNNSSLCNLKVLYIANNPLQCQCVDLIRKWAGNSDIFLKIDDDNVRKGVNPACIAYNRMCRTDVGIDFIKNYWYLFNYMQTIDLYYNKEYL